MERQLPKRIKKFIDRKTEEHRHQMIKDYWDVVDIHGGGR